MKEEVLFPDSISLYQVDEPKNDVRRREQISTIYLYFEKSKLIYVNGPENIGKTTLLKQIVNDRKYEIISLFIDEYDCEMLTEIDLYKDVYMQSRVITSEYSSRDRDEYISREKFTSEISSLFYFLREKKKELLFVLDGFDTLSKKNPRVAKEFLQSLNSNRSVKYLISTSEYSMKDIVLMKNSMSFSLLVMSELEAQEMLPNLSPEEVKEVINSFGSMPDKLSIISRLIEEGKCINDILLNTDNDTNALYDAEWNFAINNEIREQLVGFVTFSSGKLSLSDLSICLKIESRELEIELEDISFLKSDGNLVYFINDGFAKFSRTKLDSLKSKFLEVLITLVEEKKIEDAADSLSFYYSEAGKHQSIIEHIDEEYLSDVYSKKSSYNELLKNINLALKSSMIEHNGGKATKFAHLKSFVSNIENEKVFLDEINCYLSNSDYKSAKDLADNSRSIEEKIQLYCTIAIHYKDKGLDIPDDISLKIEQIFEALDVRSLRDDKIIDISVDLFPIFPKLSMKLVNEIDRTHTSGQNQSDFAFLKLSLETLRRHGNSLSEDLEEFDKALDKKSSMLDGIKIFNPDSPVEKILEYIDNQEQAGDKIFLLRAWLYKYYEKRSAITLLNKLLGIIISTIEFSSDATLYADISMCLTTDNVKCNIEAEKSYKTILSQIDSIRTKGPTIEYCKVETYLASYEINNNIKSERINNLVNYLISLTDKSISLSCLSLISKFLDDREVSTDKKLIQRVSQNKLEIFDSLIKTEALHIDVFKDAIRYEARVDIDNAIGWIKKLNTSSRQDASMKVAIESYTENFSTIKHRERVFNYWYSNCLTIRDDYYRSIVCKYLVRIFDKSKCSKRDYHDAIKYIKKLDNTPIKIKGLTNLSVSALRKEIINEFPSDVFTYLNSYIDDLVDGVWNKISLCFYISNKLFDVDVEKSNHFKNKAIELRKEHKILNGSVNNYITHTSDLIIRAVYVLSKYNLVTEDKLNLVLGFINFIPSELFKIAQFSRLVSTFQKNGISEKEKYIIDNYLIPCLERIKHTDSLEYTIACEVSLPVIFCHNSELFNFYFNKIRNKSKLRSDIIIDRSIDYIFNDCILNDPYNPVKNKQYKLSYSDVMSIINLIKLINDDGNIVYHVSRLVEVIESLRKKSLITKTQLLYITSLLEDEILTLLPKANGIKHEGYLLLLKSNILQIKNKEDKNAWNIIIENAGLIDNKSDLSFTLGTIASYLPNSMKVQKKELLERAESLADELDCKTEQVTRYRQLCEIIKETDKKNAQRVIKKAVYESSVSDIDPNSPTRLNAIDMSHKLGESFAGSLSSMFDDDPARKKAIQENIERNIEEEKQRKKFEKNEIDFESHIAFDLPDLAWSQLGSINANSCFCSKGFDLNKNINIVSNFEFEDFYKLLSFYIHYTDIGSPGTQTAQERVLPILDELLKNMSLIKRVFADEHSNISIGEYSNDDHIVVSDGEEEKAFNFIESWFREEATSEVTIIDPYFDLTDLRMIADVINKDPEVKVNIMTSIAIQNKILEKYDDDFSDIIDSYWKDNISNSDHPNFEFTFVGYGRKNQIPVHDRWWLTSTGGISVGTSINGLGHRISQITKLTLDSRASVYETVSPLLDRKMSKFDGEKVKYKIEII
ncbi:ATP-binding protein [Vibrio parahaemolyticus]|nr:ATP-binding protein [Vibrio parahaemolyticus]